MTTPADTLSPRLENLLARSAATVRRAAARYGLPEDDIEDVLQDVRIRLWRALERRETEREVPASYVYRAAVSAALDFIRRRRARREEGIEARQADLLQIDPEPERALETSEVLDAIEAAVSSLAEPRQLAVRMHLAGYHRLEIAELVGWSEAKARNLLYRGLQDLRVRLAELGIGPEEGTK